MDVGRESLEVDVDLRRGLRLGYPMEESRDSAELGRESLDVVHRQDLNLSRRLDLGYWLREGSDPVDLDPENLEVIHRQQVDLAET